MADEITLDAPETRLERFLAAAAGMDGITLDEPETRVEKYLYKIAQGSGGVPAVEDADKGKYLHANESTGDLEWAAAGGTGGGVLVCNMDDATGALDHTWKEIYDAGFSVMSDSEGQYIQMGVWEEEGDYGVAYWTFGLEIPKPFLASSADDYPVYSGDEGGGGNT